MFLLQSEFHLSKSTAWGLPGAMDMHMRDLGIDGKEDLGHKCVCIWPKTTV